MKGRWAVLLLSTFVLAAGGCVHVRNGIHNALDDTLDLARADLTFSFGTDMGGHVMITKWAQLKSYSYEDVYRVGIGNRMIGLWKDAREDWWVGPIHARNIHINSESIWVKSAGLSTKVIGGPYFAKALVAEAPDEVGIGVHLFVAGFRVGVRPFEFFDLLANLVGRDPAGDNPTWAMRQQWRAIKNHPPRPKPDKEVDPEQEE